MTYYDSAEGETISKERAFKELEKHGITCYDEFLNECGDLEEYDAQKVLNYLGY